MPSELLYLAWSVVLLVVHVLVQGVLNVRETGAAYNAGPRDEGREVRGVHAGRAVRALKNFGETYPAFIGLALALAIAGKTGGIGALGAALWFWGRVAYLPLYLFGAAYVRTVAWAAALIGLILMLIDLLS